MRDSHARERAAQVGPPTLITAAAPSYSEQYNQRRRKYAVIMLARIPCLLLALAFYQIWWLALAFIVLSVPLPWIAVLIANDRPPRKAENVNRYRRSAAELESRHHTVIES